MLQINCPWCGIRDEDEFTCGGQSHISRPSEPSKVSDEQWATYLFERINPAGINLERWRHTFGCRQWFNVARDTVNHEVIAVYEMTSSIPELPELQKLATAIEQSKEALL